MTDAFERRRETSSFSVARRRVNREVAELVFAAVAIFTTNNFVREAFAIACLVDVCRIEEALIRVCDAVHAADRRVFFRAGHRLRHFLSRAVTSAAEENGRAGDGTEREDPIG